jgi:hypothetical protein
MFKEKTYLDTSRLSMLSEILQVKIFSSQINQVDDVRIETSYFFIMQENIKDMEAF